MMFWGPVYMDFRYGAYWDFSVRYTVWSLISFTCQTGLRFQYAPTFGTVKMTVPKAQYGPENPYKRKEISVRGGRSTFYRTDYHRTQKELLERLFQSFLTDGEIFIFEVCGKHTAAKVLQPPEPKSKIQPVPKNLM